jgi:hypothetical protein
MSSKDVSQQQEREFYVKQRCFTTARTGILFSFENFR